MNEILSGYTAYDNNGNLFVGEALATPTTATADEILSGYTAYDNNGKLIKGTFSGRAVQAGVIKNAGDGATSSANKDHTVTYNNNLGVPKAIYTWFQLETTASYSPYIFYGSIGATTPNAPTSGTVKTYRNQNQTSADSTMTVNSKYVKFSVAYYDHLSSYELCYIFIW